MTRPSTKPGPKLRPPRGLSAEAKALWVRIMQEHVCDDGASQALLGELCFALDGLRACQRAIATDGLMTVGSRGQRRAHPLLGSEAEYRRQVLAAIRALRLDVAPEY
jgi:hypothetical protein